MLLLSLALLCQLETSSDTAETTGVINEIVSELRRNAQQARPVYAELEVHSRLVDLRQGPTSELEIEASVDPKSFSWRACWARSGNVEYWEIECVRGTQLGEVSWTDGETWTRMTTDLCSAIVGESRPVNWAIIPSRFFFDIEDYALDLWASRVSSNCLTIDPRWSERSYRAELNITSQFPPRRYMMVFSAPPDAHLKRMYRIHDDLLVDDYELKETIRLPSGGVIPKRYRLFAYDERPHGHCMLPETFFDWDCTIVRANQTEPLLAALPSIHLPEGVVVLNESTGERFVTGTSKGDGLDEFVQRRQDEVIRSAENQSTRDQTVTAEAKGGWHWPQLICRLNSSPARFPIAAKVEKGKQVADCGPIALHYLLTDLRPGQRTPCLKDIVEACQCNADGALVDKLLSVGREYGLKLECYDFGNRKLPTARAEGRLIAIIGQKVGVGGSHLHCEFLKSVQVAGRWRWLVVDPPNAVELTSVSGGLEKWTGMAILCGDALQSDVVASAMVMRRYQVGIGLVLGITAIVVMLRVFIKHASLKKLLHRMSGASMLILLLGCGAKGKEAGSSAPLAALEPSLVDLGQLDAPCMREVHMRLVNLSKGPILIGGVTTSCNCVSTVITGTRVDANMNVDVPFELHVSYRGRREIHVKVDVHGVDSDQHGQLEGVIAYSSERSVVAEPSRLVYPRSQDKDISRIVEVHSFLSSSDDTSLCKMEVASAPRGITAACVGTTVCDTQDGRRVDFKFRIDGHPAELQPGVPVDIRFQTAYPSDRCVSVRCAIQE